MINYIDFKKDKNFLLFSEYIYGYDKGTVLLKKSDVIKNASDLWTPEYIKSINSSLQVVVKKFNNNKLLGTENLSLGEYVDYLVKYRSQSEYSDLLYCHDIPLLTLLPKLKKDIVDSFIICLPKFYREQWWKYVQFFMGPKGSWTPLHFDCLFTHNIFFQVRGRKKFYIINSKKIKDCEIFDWRWGRFNPEKPNYNKFKKIKKEDVFEVVVEAGDIFYMPPGTLHAVKSLEESISFNIDFHTKKSVLMSLTKLFQGMPMKNTYYNFICALGLIFNIPSKYLFKYYKSYLNYIS